MFGDRNSDLKEVSIRSTLFRNISLTFIFGGLLLSSLIILVTFFSYYHVEESNRKIWAESFPASIRSSLVELDYVPIFNQVHFINKTGLFSEFSVFDSQGNLITSNLSRESVKMNLNTRIPIRDELGQTWGFFQTKDNIKLNLSLIFKILIIILGVFFIMLVGLKVFLYQKIKDIFDDLDKFILQISNYAISIKSISKSDEYEKLLSTEHIGMNEEKIIWDVFKIFLESLKTANYRIVESEKKITRAQVAYDLAAEVSHDIRSPLTALNVVMLKTETMPDDLRKLGRSAIDRINSIANSLLSKSEGVSIVASSTVNHSQLNYIPEIVEEIVIEKRILFEEKKDLKINFQCLERSGTLFSNVDSSNLKRVISNLLNNAAEAMVNYNGNIHVIIEKIFDGIKIVVSDDGKGIPADILPILGVKGGSYGKEHLESGSGLGLYYAKQFLEKIGGRLKIESKENYGTRIELVFPSADAPGWFLESIVLFKKQTVVIVDDDLSIHQRWKSKISSSGLNDASFELLFFSYLKDFETWISKDQKGRVELFLIDYEFDDQSGNGLEIIKKYEIGDKSVLVTSRFDDLRILELSEKLKFKILPKHQIEDIRMEIK